MRINNYCSTRELKISNVTDACLEMFQEVPEHLSDSQVNQLDVRFGKQPIENISLPETISNENNFTLDTIYVKHVSNLRTTYFKSVADIDETLFQLEQKVYEKIASYMQHKSEVVCARINKNLTAYKERQSLELDQSLLQETMEFLELLQ
jgi:hypothetical protein